MKIAIIGAGAAGLASARHISSQGMQCEIFEMSAEIGGTWMYTDAIGSDKHGFPVHTAMYKGLRANLPKEIMGFPDFPIPERDESFLTQKDILQFLNLYTDHFNLRNLIKFNQIVTEVRPIESRWQIRSIHKPTRVESVDFYDYVVICNGHYNTPIQPKLADLDKFKGTILHSHQYRSIEAYKNQTVLVIGAGPSGLDIALQISAVAQSVVISHHSVKREIRGEYPTNVIKKPEVLRIRSGNEVEFLDGSSCFIDTIMFCTGYRYSFPFLHHSCGVAVKDKHVSPLYKHMIHIEKPSMCFIGIPYYVCAFQMFDLQARFYCQFLNGSMKLPTKEAMRRDLEEDMMRRKQKGYGDGQYHLLGHDQKEYFADLASLAKVTPIASVISKIWSNCDDRFYNDLVNFRKDKYRIVNNDTFVKLS